MHYFTFILREKSHSSSNSKPWDISDFEASTNSQTPSPLLSGRKFVATQRECRRHSWPHDSMVCGRVDLKKTPFRFLYFSFTVKVVVLVPTKSWQMAKDESKGKKKIACFNMISSVVLLLVEMLFGSCMPLGNKTGQIKCFVVGNLRAIMAFYSGTVYKLSFSHFPLSKSVKA